MQKRLKQAITMIGAIGMFATFIPVANVQAKTAKFSAISNQQKLKSFKWHISRHQVNGSTALFDIKVTNHTNRAFTFTPKNIHMSEGVGKKRSYHYPIFAPNKTFTIRAHHSVIVKQAFTMREIEFTGAENQKITTYLTYGTKKRISPKFTNKHAQKVLTNPNWH